MKQMKIYDGTGSLSAAIAGLGVCSIKSNNKISALTKAALKALNIQIDTTMGLAANAPIRLKIWEWVRDNVEPANKPVTVRIESSHTSEPGNVEPICTTELPVELALQTNHGPVESIHITGMPPVEHILQGSDESMEVKKERKQYASHYAYKTIAFRMTDGRRHIVKVESYLVDALSTISISDIPKFFSENVSNEWIETVGDKSLAKMLKRIIVQALLNRIET